MLSVKKRDQEQRRAYRLTKPDGQHFRRKLTAEQVHEIRFGTTPYNELAERYGVSTNVIHLAGSGQTYKDHPMNPEQPNGRRPLMFTAEQVVSIRERAANGESMTRIADEFGTARGSIYAMVARRSYKWVR